MNFIPPRYYIPALSGICVAGTLLLAGTFVVPKLPASESAEKKATKSIAAISIERREIPEIGEVLEKHLFVPERKAVNMKSNSDLVVKGVYVGERESNVVLSLRSKPAINLRVWQKEREALLAKITDPKDPRYPLVTFLKEWDIHTVSFNSVTFHNMLTDESETYEVDYTPTKKVADNALNGYGQGAVQNISDGDKSGAAAPKKTSGTPNQNTPTISADMAKMVSSRVTGMMERMSPQQRKQFTDAVNNASKNKTEGNKNGTTSQNGRTKKSTKK